MARLYKHELDWQVKRVLERGLKSRGFKVTGLQEFLAEISEDILKEVPSEAFEPAAPRDRGILFYHGDIDESRVHEMQEELISVSIDLATRDTKTAKAPITLNLSTSGGSCEAGIALVGTIQDIQRTGRDVNVHVQGGAYSMGSIILQAGSKRTMEPYSFLMIHDSWYAMEGKTPLHADLLDFIRRQDYAVAQLFAARGGKSPEYYLNKWDRKDWYLGSVEALDEGLVDEILEAPIYRRFRKRTPTSTAKPSER